MPYDNSDLSFLLCSSPWGCWRQSRGDLLSLFFLAQLTLLFYFLLSAPYTADPGLPSPSLRSTCISAATAAQMNSATSFGSSSLCPFMPLTHGSVSCSSPMTSTMFTLAQCGTAMKVRRGQTENGEGGKSLPWENFISGWELHFWREHRCHLLNGVPSWMTMSSLVTENHRMVGWFVSGWTIKDHLVQHPCHGLGHLSLDEVAQSPVQLDSLPHWPLSVSLPSRVL